MRVLLHSLLSVSLWKWNPRQLLIYSMEVNIYSRFWTLKMKCTQYGICGWVAFQECKDHGFFEIGWGGYQFLVGSWNVDFFLGAAHAHIYQPQEVGRGRFNAHLKKCKALKHPHRAFWGGVDTQRMRAGVRDPQPPHNPRKKILYQIKNVVHPVQL